MNWIIYILIGLILCMLAYIRLAPSNVQTWHVMPAHLDDKTLEGGVIRTITGGQAEFARLNEIITSSVRTSLLAGSTSSGMVTYISRTPIIGFPDYTTVQLKDGQISLYGRLRFGRRDFGVNQRRIQSWLMALSQL